jgi:hypothetical protein
MLRLPLLHFLVLGGALFGAQQLLPVREEIRFSAAQVEQLERDWQRSTGAAPTEAQLAASLRHAADEEILLREALRLGLDERDTVARRRLLQNLAFAFPDAAGDDAARLRQARRLGMNARDPVVRGRLIQLMQQRAENGAPPDAAEVDAYIAAHADRYAAPSRIAFRQMFFSADRRGGHARADAQAALAALRRGATPAADPFLLGLEFPPTAHADVARLLGEEAAHLLEQAPAGDWIGPVASVYGAHLLQVTRVEAAQPPDLSAVRTPATYAALHAREGRALAQRLDLLRARYRLELPDGRELAR